MPEVEREVAPHVAFRRRDLPASAQVKKGLHSGAAPFQRGNELTWGDAAVIDAGGNAQPVLSAERLDPHTPGVVKVSGDSAYRPPRRPWNRELPQRRRQVSDE